MKAPTLRLTLLWLALLLTVHVAWQTTQIERKPPARVGETLRSTEAKEILDSAISIIKDNALRSKNVSWTVVEPIARKRAAAADNRQEVYGAIRYVLAQLRDHHSSLWTPSRVAALGAGGAENPKPMVKALPERIGYVSVPGYRGSEPYAMRGYAARLHQSLGMTMASAGCGWVIDLRSNTGGNAFVMFAGLKPFLGSDAVGASEGSKSAPWVAGEGVGVQPPSMLLALETARVAVLTGRRTASAGEAVAIAFRGRPRTRSFGEPTAGLSTSNSPFQLPDGAVIMLTTAVDADRTGRRYGATVEPDQRVESSRSPWLTGDRVLSVATTWLSHSGGCR